MVLLSTYAYITILALSTFVCFFIFRKLYKKVFRTNSIQRRRPAAVAAGARRRVGGGNALAGRRLAARMRMDSESDDQSLNQNENHDQVLEESSKKDPLPKKVGTKKAAKLAEKERRKEEREADERYREHQRKLEDKEIEKRKKAEDAEIKAAAERQAAEAKLRQEEEAREQAEYELIKQQFSIEDEGMDDPELDSRLEAQLIADLIRTIQEAKVITLERLAVQFKLKTEVCVEKIRSLLSSNRLTGVLDDRGKFIYITNEEFEAVAQFIENRGRVTLNELVQSGNNLVQVNALRC